MNERRNKCRFDILDLIYRRPFLDTSIFAVVNILFQFYYGIVRADCIMLLDMDYEVISILLEGKQWYFDYSCPLLKYKTAIELQLYYKTKLKNRSKRRVKCGNYHTNVKHFFFSKWENTRMTIHLFIYFNSHLLI